MRYTALIQKSIYSLGLYAFQHPEYAAEINVLQQKLAESFGAGDVEDAVSSAALTITEVEETDMAAVGLICYWVKLCLSEPDHPDLELCERMAQTISSTEGWEPRNTPYHYLAGEGSIGMAGPQL